MALRTNRDVEGWHDPHTRQWAQHHILYPDGGGEAGTDHDTPRPNYLHDLPLPVPEILHFFGFNLEMGAREVWEKTPRAYINPEWKDYPHTIDLLGSYSAEDRTVRLYEPTIQKAAEAHGWDVAGLAEVMQSTTREPRRPAGGSYGSPGTTKGWIRCSTRSGRRCTAGRRTWTSFWLCENAGFRRNIMRKRRFSPKRPLPCTLII
ncbi:MAG: hypothetical protein EBZ78_10165 [Verrucomicrobia bacterium]|nr:hypothetical protein [Verrucomicrobiota bacterium]